MQLDEARDAVDVVRVPVGDHSGQHRAVGGDQTQVVLVQWPWVDDDDPVRRARITYVLVPSSVIGPGFGARMRRTRRRDLDDSADRHIPACGVLVTASPAGRASYPASPWPASTADTPRPVAAAAA